MASKRVASRRRHSAQLRAQILNECEAAGASVARVAMSHGINANVVHRWRQLAREGGKRLHAPVSEFVPVSLATTVATTPESSADIHIELRRGATSMTIAWPAAAAADCAAWMRELLR